MQSEKHNIVGSRAMPAFTFTEVMFAVIILGLGFIMVAALFPVGIAQKKSNTEETVASSLGRHGVAVVQNRFPGGSLGGTGGQVTWVPWTMIAGDVIDSSDPRYAWTALYSRGGSGKVANIYVFALAVRNAETFTAQDVQSYAGGHAANLQPRPVKVVVTHGSPSQVKVMAWGTDAQHQKNWQAADANAYIVIAGSGRIYRLGALVTQDGTSATYELIPGNSTASSSEDIPETPDAMGWLIGKSYGDLANPGGGYAGTAMPTGVYVGVIPVD